MIPTTLNASALRDPDGRVIGAIGILRDMRELDKARAYAESLIKNAPDPVFVSDLEGKILQANDAVSELLGFRPDEVVEQSLSRFISPEETREFTAALREVVERGVTRNARLNPRSASGEVIPTTLNASALRDSDGKVIGAIGILRDMRAYEEVVQRPRAVEDRAAGEDPRPREVRGGRRRPRAEDDRAREGAREPAAGEREAQGGPRLGLMTAEPDGARQPAPAAAGNGGAELDAAELREQVEQLQRSRPASARNGGGRSSTSWAT